MSRQCLAYLPISSLQIQQGLAVTLALMITLLAGQLYQRWHESHEAQPRAVVSYQHFNAVSSRGTPASHNQAILQRAESSNQVAPQQSWVF